MALPTDFAAAHKRHWSDAEFLYGYERLGNADHLYGLSAECGLKAVMKGLGMPVDSSGRPKAQEHRKHVQDLWPEFRAFASRRDGRRYLQELPAECPFSDWSHHDRYARTGHMGPEEILRHRVASRHIQQMVQAADMDGTL